MTFSVGVLTTLVLLLPGIALLIGVLWGASHGAIRQTLPATNSLTAIAIILLGSMSAHVLAELILLLQSALCEGNVNCENVSFNPNLYEAWFGSGDASPAQLPAGQVAWTLVGLGALSGISFGAGYKILSADLADNNSKFGPLIYGWLSPYVVGQQADAQAITAFVLTKMRTGEMAVGYRGILNEFNLSAESEISSVTMLACDRFGLNLGEAPSGQRTITLNELLPVVHIPGREVENIVLRLIPLDEAEQAPVARTRASIRRAAPPRPARRGRRSESD